MIRSKSPPHNSSSAKMKKTLFNSLGRAGLALPVFFLVAEFCSGQANKEIQIEGLIRKSANKLQQKFGLKADELALVVDPSSQKIFVMKDQAIFKTFPVSTSQYGIGNEYGSRKTPPGVHRIKEKIGHGAKPGAIFKERRKTGRIAEIFTDKTDVPGDLVTTRILWLDGLEKGINKGGRNDTHSRYIYIHGTPEEGLIGSPASRGCIRMRNADVIELFELVSEGTLVEILAVIE